VPKCADEAFGKLSLDGVNDIFMYSFHVVDGVHTGHRSITGTDEDAAS